MTMTLYVETSAILAALLGEPESKVTAKALTEADTVVSSALTLLECERALIRHHLQGGFSEADCKQTVGVVKR